MNDDASTGDVVRVFLSSTAEDLEPYREAVLAALHRMDHVYPVNQETFGARGQRTVAGCLQRVRTSDLVVALVAHRYGWVPSADEEGDGESSITALEIAAAEAADLPVMAFIVDEDYPWTQPKEQDALVEAATDSDAFEVYRRVRLLKGLKQQLHNRIRDTFTTAGDLAARVATAVGNELAERTQTRMDRALKREREPQQVPPSKFVNPPPDTARSWFQDRHAETRLVADFLRKDDWRVMTVVGRTGIGKTALVCRLLKSLEAGQLPDDLGELPVDGIVYLSSVGRHKVTYHNLITDLARLLDEDTAQQILSIYTEPGHDPGELMWTLLEHFSDAPVAVLLDNFESVLDDESETITDAELRDALLTVMCAPHHSVKVLITSRIFPDELVTGDNAIRHKAVHLDEGLGSPDAENVLRALDTDGSVGLAGADDELLSRARELTRGFLRALEALYSILERDRSLTLEKVLDDAAGAPPDEVVEVLVGRAFDGLDPTSQQVMQVLGLYPAPVPAVAIDFLLQPEIPAVNAAPVLARLARSHLVSTAAGRYHLHPIDRDYALARLSADDGNRRATLEVRAADYYRQTRTPRSSWRSIDDLVPQLTEFEFRCRQGDYATAADVLADIDADYLQMWGHYRLLLDLHAQLDGRLSDPRRNGIHLTNAGLSYYYLGDYTRAIEQHTQALEIAQRIDDPKGESRCLRNIGRCYDSLGDYTRAIEQHTRALEIAQRIDDLEGQGGCLGSIGDSHYSLSQYREAIDYHNQALDIARRNNDPKDESRCLANIGNCHYALGDYGKAIDHHEQALDIARQINHQEGQGARLGNLGRSHHLLGDYEKAIDCHEQALDIARQINHRQGEGRYLANLGDCHQSRGDYKAAIDNNTQALDIARQINHRPGEGRYRNNLGICHQWLGDYETAIDHHDQALDIFRQIGNRQGKGRSLTNLGNCHQSRGDYENAIDHHTRAIDIARQIENRYLEACALVSLARAHRGPQHRDAAGLSCRVALTIADEIGAVEPRAEARVELIRILLAQGDAPAALDVAIEAQAITYPPMLADSWLLGGVALLLLDRSVEAAEAFGRAVEHADHQLPLTEIPAALDTQALALCGLTLTGTERVDEARQAFERARALSSETGDVDRTMDTFDLLAGADRDSALVELRTAAKAPQTTGSADMRAGSH